MKSIFSIFVAGVLYSSLAVLSAADNYSLWPRRPEELEQARRLVQEQKWGEAVLLLQPFVKDEGIAGREARQICGRVNVARYLSPLHPGARVYTVRRGDNMARISVTQKCPQDVILLLNGIIDPSNLRIGQKLVVVPMRLRAVINPMQREISVWDGEQLVAHYPVTGSDTIPAARRKTEKTHVKSREGYLNGHVVLPRAPMYPASERVLVLANGMTLTGGQKGHSSLQLRMDQKDLNELALMLDCGNEVIVSYPEH